MHMIKRQDKGNCEGLIERLPALGWTELFPIPQGLKGGEILFVGSAPNTAELVIDYRTKEGVVARGCLAAAKAAQPPAH